MVNDKYLSGTKVSKKTLVISYKGCTSHIQVSDIFYTNAIVGQQILIRGIHEKCEFCEIEDIDNGDKTISVVFLVASLSFLIDVFIKIYPSWILED